MVIWKKAAFVVMLIFPYEKGDSKLGTRVEVKNLNSIRNVKRAVDAEAKRLIDMLENGKTIIQQTRSFDANTGTTFAIRDKEDADDYRYFAEPDLTPFHLQDEFIDRIRNSLPALAEQRIQQYTSSYQLSEYDAAVLTEEKAIADYFESIIKHTNNCKAAANWMLGPVKTWMNEEDKEIDSFPLQPVKLAELIKLVDSGKVSFSVAAGKLFKQLLKTPMADCGEMAKELNLCRNLMHRP